MELKEFITTTLVQIAEGVSAARPVYEEKGGIINPKGFDFYSSDIPRVKDSAPQKLRGSFPVCNIQFEVSLSQDKSSKTSGGIGVLLGAVSAGGKTGEESGENAYSKIKFNIPVCLP